MTRDTFEQTLLESEQIDCLLQAAGPEGVADIMDAFWRSTADLMTAVRAQAASGDFVEAAKTAHALKGSASNVGASLLAQLAHRIEEISRSGDGERLAEQIDDAAEAVDQTRSAVDEMIAKAS